MKAKQPHARIVNTLALLVVVILLLVPLHAFLTVWLASIFGHYTILRLWKEFLLMVLLAGVVYLLQRNPTLRWKLLTYKLHWFLLAYLLVQLFWGVVALLMHSVSAKALGYAWIINLRFLAFYVVAWAVALHAPTLTQRWYKLVLWPLAVVLLVGLLLYFVLPYDFLKHFGYNEQTIYPYETVNHNIHHLRMFSTLRGANPLGAYLVLALTVVAAIWLRTKRWVYALLLALGLVCLVLTFSRSAWIGMVLSTAVLAFASIRDRRWRLAATGAFVGFAVIASVAGLLLRHNIAFQDAFFHTDQNSKITVSSNQGHVSAFKNGLHDLLHEPLGRGPGSAGPASVYNNHPGRIAENYYIQVGQETGWPGLILFVLLNIVVARALWRRRHQTLAMSLFAALIGLSFVNLLSHAWADDTLAYLWWGLAGLAVGKELTAADERPLHATEHATK